jgi:two-component system cell cycle response regulator DivK
MTTILYVEDNDSNVYVLEQRLKRKGYTVLVARDGREGLAVARRMLPDLVIMDLDLPVVDGWEATRQLKADERTASIPVMALTAHALTGESDAALAAGCDDFDTKPIQFKQLHQKILALLAMKPSREDGEP